MNLVLAQTADRVRIMEIINQAKAYFKESGIDQWQRGYPDEECIQEDISTKKGYLMQEGQETVGYLCVDFDGEESYKNLKGQWKSIKAYVAVHRVVIDNGQKGKGLAMQAIAEVEEICKAKGVHSIKIDTDTDNAVMRHFLDKSGFEYCGTIWFDYGDKVAYEKVF